MAIGWSIAILIASAVIMLLLKIFFKNVYRVVSIIWLVLFLGSIAFGLLIYVDSKDLANNFAGSDNLFALQSEGKIIAGYITKGDAEPDLVENLDELQGYFEKQDYDGMLKSGKYYKEFILNESCFDNMSDVDLGELKISKDTVLQLLKSEDPIGDYALWFLEENSIESGFKQQFIDSLNSDAGINTSAGMKAAFFNMLTSAASIQDPSFLIKNFRKGNIIIYEESLSFKLIKYFPESILNDLLNKKEVE